MNTKTANSALETEQHRFLTRTYSLMALALLISAVSAFFVTKSQALQMLIFGSKPGFMVLAVAELVLVIALSFSIRKISSAAATFMYLVYSILNGLTISSIFFVYQIQSISVCFISAAGMFLGMSVWGATTKRNLSSFGHFLMMALYGVLLATLISWLCSFIFKNIDYGMVDWVISVLMVLIFTGITAWDTQRIFKTSEFAQDSDDYKKVAVIGALQLYLDFINIFLRLLYLFGKRRD